MTGPSEAQTIRDSIVPALDRAGWPAHRIEREFAITGRKREVVGGRVRRGTQLAADIVLLHASGHPICAVEAKRSLRSEHDGVQQAKDYGTRLALPIVYATNGRKIIEVDLYAGTQREVAHYRSAEELWTYYRSTKDLNSLGVHFFEVPYSRDVIDAGSGQIKQMRYYQHEAAQAVLRAIAAGQPRILTVLATGSGKSLLAAQLVHVLWQSHWPRGPAALDPRPRVLYLSDRDVLIKDPRLKYFIPIFGSDEVHRIQTEAQAHKRIYFALYQALDEAQLFEQYDGDFFDLVIVDECHRGSAREDSAWRRILDHFSSAIHLGMTATPRSDQEADNLAYFGEPVFTYSLRQGIEDGFLAPFQVLRVPLSSDVDGVHIPAGTLDDEGNEVPEGDYGQSAFERRLVLPERTQAAAAFLSDYLEYTDRMAKTVVFCVNQDHAARFVQAIANRNSDLVAAHPFWAARITSAEGDRGKELLEHFQDGDSPTPVVVTSSDLLTTGVDAPNVRTVVFFAVVRSMARFKQMLGRGTRLDEDRGKEAFTVIDFTGVTAKFADPTFDGPPVRVSVVDVTDPAPGDEVTVVDAADDPPEAVQVNEPESPFAVQPGGELPVELPAGVPVDGGVVDDPGVADEVIDRARRFVVSGQDVYVLASMLFVVETSDSFRLRAVRLDDWVRERVLDLGYDAASLRARWANATSRRALTEALSDAIPLGLDELAGQLGHPESEPLDLLLHLAFGAELISRAERAARFTVAERRFLDGFGEQAREILDTVLAKYVEHGPYELDVGILQVPPLSERGSVTELAGYFGGPNGLASAFNQVNLRLYRAS